jgi:penicillin amidase
MFFELHDSEARQEYHMGLVRESMPEEWVAFLCQKGSSWDAPIEGLPMTPAPIPESKPATGTGSPLSTEEPQKPGSNNWAVGGALTETGAGLLANDMHLGISNPNTWYRADLNIGTELRITGVSLPGVPGIVSGSNGAIAWGFTNSFGDYCDLILLEVNEKGTHYLSPSGWSAFSEKREVIKVKNEPDQEVVFQRTEWGPVLTRGGHSYALTWTAHHAESLYFNLHHVMLAQNVDQALAVAPSCGLPPQNLALVDRDGNVAWTIIGKIPQREGYSGRFPMSWAKPGVGWKGWLSAEETPFIKNPAHHRVWTANARVVSGENLKKIGDGGYDFGARAKQIKTRLFEKERFSEQDFLDIQLDFEAQFLGTWKHLFEETLKRGGHSPNAEKARALLAQWEGYAATESCAYLFVRNCRVRIMSTLLGKFTGPCKTRDRNFQAYRLPQTESPIWSVLTAQPTHLLPEGSKSWDDWIIAQVEAEVSELEKKGPLEEQVWGKRNSFSARHVMSANIPIVGSWLNSKPIPLPGDSHMPRVQGRNFGASERLIVSPGHESKGIFHMPGGQSGHPLSPYFLKGIEAWASGEPSPFLPGPPEHTLLLKKTPM